VVASSSSNKFADPTSEDVVASSSATSPPDVVVPTSSAVKPRSAAKSRRFFSPLLFALCMLFAAVRLPFIFTVPMVEAPDEYAHYWVARFLSDYHRLPHAAEVFAGGPSAVYGSLPQLGYLPHLAVASLFHQNDFVLFIRFGSLAMGMVLFYCAYALGRELFPRQRLLSLALPLAVIFHPQLVFVHAYLNNDSTSSAVASVLLLLAVRSLRCGISMPLSVSIGVLTGWLALTKYSGLGILPSVAVCLIASAFINRIGIGRALLNFGTSAVIAAGLCGWWFVRNLHEFQGDLMGTKTMYLTWATTFHRELTYYLPASHIIKNIRWWRMMFFSFWGMFGYMNKYMWRPVYFIYLGYVIVAAVGFLKMVAVRVIDRVQARNVMPAPTIGSSLKDATEGDEAQRNSRIQTVAWSALGLSVVLNLASMIWASTTNLGGPQGRYLFTSELPVLALMIGGISLLSKKYGTRLVLSFLLFNAFVCVCVWVWLCNIYGFHGHPL
jgi:hypothetical protein